MSWFVVRIPLPTRARPMPSSRPSDLANRTVTCGGGGSPGLAALPAEDAAALGPYVLRNPNPEGGCRAMTYFTPERYLRLGNLSDEQAFLAAHEAWEQAVQGYKDHL